jgi:hypothetical protein
MSLDEFMKSGKKKDGEKEPEKPASAKDAVKKENVVKKEKTQKPARKSPAKGTAKSTPSEAGREAPLAEESDVEPGTAEEPAQKRESVLKEIGLVKYTLACAACKFKKELRIAGEPKPHQLLCKKCGGQMKAIKKG